MTSKEFLALMDEWFLEEGPRVYLDVFSYVTQLDQEKSPPSEPTFFPFGEDEVLAGYHVRRTMLDLVACVVGERMVQLPGITGVVLKNYGALYLRTNAGDVFLGEALESANTWDAFFKNLNKDDQHVFSQYNALWASVRRDWMEFSRKYEACCEVFETKYPLQGIEKWQSRYHLMDEVGAFVLQQRLLKHTNPGTKPLLWNRKM